MYCMFCVQYTLRSLFLFGNWMDKLREISYILYCIMFLKCKLSNSDFALLYHNNSAWHTHVSILISLFSLNRFSFPLSMCHGHTDGSVPSVLLYCVMWCGISSTFWTHMHVRVRETNYIHWMKMCPVMDSSSWICKLLSIDVCKVQWVTVATADSSRRWWRQGQADMENGDLEVIHWLPLFGHGAILCMSLLTW